MLELQLSQTMTQIMESPYQSALALYGSSKKIKVDVELEDKKLVVPAALVKGNDLAAIINGEKYAAAIGGMFFITEETPYEYRRFAAFHELVEYAAKQGFDVIGKAKHFQACVIELGYAKSVLAPKDFEVYLKWRKDVERTNFFQLKDDGLVDKIAEEIKEIYRSLPKYLTYRKKTLIET